MNLFPLSILRLFFSLITLWAVGWQLSIHAHMGFSIVNFFSYFTNLSNLFAAFVLLLTWTSARCSPRFADDLAWWTEAARAQGALKAPPY